MQGFPVHLPLHSHNKISQQTGLFKLQFVEQILVSQLAKQTIRTNLYWVGNPDLLLLASVGMPELNSWMRSPTSVLCPWLVVTCRWEKGVKSKWIRHRLVSATLLQQLCSQSGANKTEIYTFERLNKPH